MTPTLYITRNGLLEPLGQSQVMGYLRGLSRDYQITLITYEKPEDWADTDAMARARADCEAHGVRWFPQQFRPRPKIIAPAFSMFRMIWLVRREVLRSGIRLIHARSYIPAAVALVVSRMTGVPFIFDMRALWPEELITAGRLTRGSIMHRAIVAAERACLARAAGVVSLTQAAVGYLKKVYPRELEAQRVVVIPTCADLARFTLPDTPPAKTVYGCLGTVLSGWFKLDWLSAFLQVVAKHDPEARIEIVTRDDAAIVRARIDPSAHLQNLSIFSAPSERVPEIVKGHSISAMFFTEGTSKLGSAPTRLAEVLGSGIPVVANEGVGDVAQIIRHYRVGVIARDASEAAMREAVTELTALRRDPELSARCRQAAEEVFSLERGTEDYRQLYAAILNEADGAQAPSSSAGAANNR
jgi:glycosyltransferase involved in cell wall biosynthesis